MPRWQMIFTFPNLVPPVPSPFEVDHLYLCAASDRRLEQLATNPGNASGLQIVKQFSSTFGEPYESGCLLMRDDAPDSVREEEALRAFRNVCAISSITSGLRPSLKFGTHSTRASTIFDF